MIFNPFVLCTTEVSNRCLYFKVLSIAPGFWIMYVEEKFYRTSALLLIVFWFGLISSLIAPNAFCNSAVFVACSDFSKGSIRLFWGQIIPLVLIILLLNHHLWRRICPLSAISRIGEFLNLGRFSYINIRRRRIGRWLSRHHLKLQWIFLFFAIVFRIFLTNVNPFYLALFLICVVLMAFVVGIIYGDKTWCQYVCPIGPVQSIIAGENPLIRNKTISPNPSLGPSACLEASGKGFKNSCSSCIPNCIDIDSRRHFWSNLTANKDMSWVCLSYPGLVLGYFCALFVVGNILTGNGLNYLIEGSYLGELGFDVIGELGYGYKFVNAVIIISTPAIISIMCISSFLVFRMLENIMARRLKQIGVVDFEGVALCRIRHLSSLIALNLFFGLSPLNAAFGSFGALFLRYAVLILTTLKLRNSWRIGPSSFLRERVSKRFAKELKDCYSVSDLGGRSFGELSPDEIFIIGNLKNKL